MRSIKQTLSSACCALLGTSSLTHAQTEPWIIDLGAMNYIEKDRNTGVELIVKASRALDDGGDIALQAELDVITGATPNGATASNVPQTFTMSSGVGSYTVDANELPADDTHMDTRLGLKAEVTDPVSEVLLVDYNALISMEFDYLAFAAGAGFALDFNQNNSTLVAGLNLEYNRVHPVGNTAVPFAQMNAPGLPQPRDVSSRTKRGNEISIGLNQIIDRRSLFQLRFTSSHFSGYLNDPYKIISVVENINPLTLGATQNYVFENRPDKRDMEILYFAYKRAFDSGVLDVSFRLYDDSWQLRSETLELAYKFRVEDMIFIRPSFRFYHQDQAFFYRHSLTNDEVLPEYASSDARLADFDATTIGIEVGKDLAFGRKHSITVEYYQQEGESHPNDAVGLQRQQDLYPSLKTLVFKYVYSLKW